MNTFPFLLSALCVYAIAYRYYSTFLAAKALALDDRRTAPAHSFHDGHNYVASPKWVLFGHRRARRSAARGSLRPAGDRGRPDQDGLLLGPDRAFHRGDVETPSCTREMRNSKSKAERGEEKIVMLANCGRRISRSVQTGAGIYFRLGSRNYSACPATGIGRRLRPYGDPEVIRTVWATLTMKGSALMNTPWKRKWAGLAMAAGMAALAGCSKGNSANVAPGPPEVEVAAVEQRDVPIYREWIGTLDGMVNAAIKAEVSGYLLSQDYAEGSFVRKGQLLFEIDPRPFDAALAQAKGQLAQARGQLAQAQAQLLQAQAQLAQSVANQGRTQQDVDKYAPLAKQQAVTQQDLDNAVQNNRVAGAQIEASKAGVETARAQIEAANAAVESAQAAVQGAQVNAGFTRIFSPIDGIAGQAQVQTGNLVGPGSGTITTVSTLDPIRANFTVGEREYLSLARGSDLAKLQLDLILADGSTYPRKGKFFFADRAVNQSTGSIQLTGLFPNPGNLLRPGQYGKVRAAIGTNLGALLVPQRAVTELQGGYQVDVVDSKNRVSIRSVTPGDRVGTMWIVTEGLKPGERVVAVGLQKVSPGIEISPKPFVEAD